MIFYGKRAQLVGALITFIIFLLFNTRRNFLRVLTSFILILSLSFFIYDAFSDNIAISRISNTLKKIDPNSSFLETFIEIDKARVQEIREINKELVGFDYITGINSLIILTREQKRDFGF